MMGHVFQAGWLEGNSSVCPFGCLWLRKLAKAMAKALKRKKGILAHLFMKIMEIRRKGGERSQVACEEENKGK